MNFSLFSARKTYSLKMLNRFDFIEDIDYDTIYEDQSKNQEIHWTVVWLVELKLNRGMFKFYGKSKLSFDKAFKNALIVALHFCTLKIVHEKAIPRHLENQIQFLIRCFLNHVGEIDANGSKSSGECFD